MKFSILIVAYKAEECLRRCLNSINASSISSAEIIVWDNSPQPIFKGTHEKAWSPRIPLQAYYNGTNYGFAEGCNLAAKQAQGEFLIFLNPDTQVFGDWANEMLGIFSIPTHKIGAVGPLSNFVAGTQQLALHEPAMDSDFPPEYIASMVSMKWKHHIAETKLLIGFCFMMPASVWAEVGGMDGDLFLGCDDLDLSMRLREAGYELFIAKGVFVFHEGHKSFEAAGSEDAARMLIDTEAAFRAKLLQKYGSQEAIPSSKELWGCDIFYTGRVGRQTLAINMIVRDEEMNLRELLPQLAFADEIVIVDTNPVRTADRILPIMLAWIEAQAPALKGKVKVSLFPWFDDFAAARNHALSLTTSDWVLWIDADDRVPEESARMIRAAMDVPGPLMAQRTCHIGLQLKDHGPDDSIAMASQQRIFPRIPGLYWEHAIHENYGDRANTLGLVYVNVDNIIIEHHGYSDSELTAKKQHRNIKILNTLQNTPHKFLHLGASYIALGLYPNARIYYSMLLDLDTTWNGGLDKSLMDHAKYMIAVSYYKEFMLAVVTWNRYLVANPGNPTEFPLFPNEIKGFCNRNSKPDALFLLAEHHYFAGEMEMARGLYAHYADLAITDSFGTNAATLQPVALRRIANIDELTASRKLGYAHT